MTREDIIRMAKEAADGGVWWSMDSHLMRFANLVAAAEREACEKVIEESGAYDWMECAAAIRARGEK